MRKNNIISSKLLFSLVISLIAFFIVFYVGPGQKKEAFTGVVTTQPQPNYVGCYVDKSVRAMDGDGGDGGGAGAA